MAYKKTVKILTGKNMYGTWFGLRNKAKGMYTGGFTRHLFGIKNIIGLEIERTWGDFSN